MLYPAADDDPQVGPSERRNAASRAVYHIARYIEGMARAVSVRLDDDALQALNRLEASGLTRSEAIRKAPVEAAVRPEDRQTLAAEVAALEADEADREEMLAAADLMESLRAPR
jgi:hypothetical protein